MRRFDRLEGRKRGGRMNWQQQQQVSIFVSVEKKSWRWRNELTSDNNNSKQQHSLGVKKKSWRWRNELAIATSDNNNNNIEDITEVEEWTRKPRPNGVLIQKIEWRRGNELHLCRKSVKSCDQLQRVESRWRKDDDDMLNGQKTPEPKKRSKEVDSNEITWS